MFRDRADAGKHLLQRMPALDAAETVIFALPRGGVPVAEVVAKGLGAPLDIVLVRKVGLPGHRELALASVTNGAEPVLTVNEDGCVRPGELDRCQIELSLNSTTIGSWDVASSGIDSGFTDFSGSAFSLRQFVSLCVAD